MLYFRGNQIYLPWEKETKKTRRGKIIIGSNGVRRPKAPKKKKGKKLLTNKDRIPFV